MNSDIAQVNREALRLLDKIREACAEEALYQRNLTKYIAPSLERIAENLNRVRFKREHPADPVINLFKVCQSTGTLPTRRHVLKMLGPAPHHQPPTLVPAGQAAGSLVSKSANDFYGGGANAVPERPMRTIVKAGTPEAPTASTSDTSNASPASARAKRAGTIEPETPEIANAALEFEGDDTPSAFNRTVDGKRAQQVIQEQSDHENGHGPVQDKQTDRTDNRAPMKETRPVRQKRDKERVNRSAGAALKNVENGVTPRTRKEHSVRGKRNQTEIEEQSKNELTPVVEEEEEPDFPKDDGNIERQVSGNSADLVSQEASCQASRISSKKLGNNTEETRVHSDRNNPNDNLERPTKLTNAGTVSKRKRIATPEIPETTGKDIVVYAETPCAPCLQDGKECWVLKTEKTKENKRSCSRCTVKHIKCTLVANPSFTDTHDVDPVEPEASGKSTQRVATGVHAVLDDGLFKQSREHNSLKVSMATLLDDNCKIRGELGSLKLEIRNGLAQLQEALLTELRRGNTITIRDSRYQSFVGHRSSGNSPPESSRPSETPIARTRPAISAHPYSTTADDPSGDSPLTSLPSTANPSTAANSASPSLRAQPVRRSSRGRHDVERKAKENRNVEDLGPSPKKRKVIPG